jgi:Peptidase propeptide and YPEB domain
MRSVILIAAIATLTAGAALAQSDAKQPANPPAAQTTPAAPTAPSAAAAVMTETQAKARIEAQGYADVSELKKDAQGTWSAKATKDGKAVQVSLDARGQIAVLN